MDQHLILLAGPLLLAVVALLATTWGVDTRDGFGDDHAAPPRP